MWRDVEEELPQDDSLCLVVIFAFKERVALARYYKESETWHVQPFKGKWFETSSFVTYWQYIDPKA